MTAELFRHSQQKIYLLITTMYINIYLTIIYTVYGIVLVCISIDSSNLFNTKSTFIIIGLINIVLLLDFGETLIGVLFFRGTTQQ